MGNHVSANEDFV